MRFRSGALAMMLVVAGFLAGWLVAGARPRPVAAGGGDRPDAATVTTATIAVEANPKLGVQFNTDAVYYLNYSRGFLYVAVPMPNNQVGAVGRILSDFGERDLLKDFALPPGATPHFAMASGQLGMLSSGFAPLYVFESTTGQLAVYRTEPQFKSRSSAPTLVLLEKRDDPRLGRGATSRP
jgi:hypothetical protein